MRLSLIIVFFAACFIGVLSENVTESSRDRLLLDDDEPVGRRIVGGRRALEGEFPYQVGLTAGDRGLVFCGGSIIGTSWIVTAAHCITDGNGPHVATSRLRAIAGTTNHMTRGGEVINIDRAIVHELYNANTNVNDIALLKTRNPITRGRAISLPSRGSNFSGTGVVSGWGTTTEGGRRSYDLLAANLDILPDASCYRTYRSRFRVPEMLCAGAMEGGRDTCQGDSGRTTGSVRDAGRHHVLRSGLRSTNEPRCLHAGISLRRLDSVSHSRIDSIRAANSTMCWC